ncbi:protein-disulfide reductase DsbD family protein [Candidatus Uabimicrobium amorphum]|uniref:Thiol:disulfide interchange protein n=1 Tax=Uabimicrobium amorphum TaxID=2596890 RepID=A0A5S9IKV4_UABAM|nr:thioredoxin family protein [Candidatus Uabimicrobium amorphum]BBM83743.1 thiol:disulfide interchange protein [Candidatus Uabimicrobium amorphum]
MKKLWLCIVALLLPFLYAQMDMPDPVDAELVSEQQTIEPGKSFWVSVTFKIDDHWHTYWKNPGSSGLPTTIDWKLPKGVTASDIYWATPMWINASGLVSLAYEHEVAHLVKISVDKSFSAKTLELNANVDWLVCTDVGELAGCYPGSAKVSLSLPVSKSQISQSHKAFFQKARTQLPKADEDWQVLASRNDNTLKIFLVNATAKKQYDKITFFPHQEIFKLEAKQKLSFQDGVYILETTLADTASKKLAEISGDIQLPEKSIAVNVGVVNQKVDAAKVKDLIKNGVIETSSSESVDIFLLLLNALFAFLGGIILNAMPCVLPVISLKIFSFIEDAGGDKSKIWKSGLAFTAGVLVSFWVLVGLLFAIRDFGLFGIEGAVWGYQLQSSTFVMVIVMGLIVFSLNLFGIFEIGTSLSSIGSQTKKTSGLFSSFATGVLTTIIATPCSAPFMATAIGFALAQTTVIGFSIFTSMALGLAFPYLVLSLFPGWLKLLPKPGRWMESFKKALAFPMLGTAAWQFSVLLKLVANDMYEAEQVVFDGLFAALFISLALWVYGRWGMSKKRMQAFVYSFIFFAVGIYFCHSALNPQPETWIKFSPQKVEQLTAQDKPVFIDFTAAWCITCQLNKKVALRTEEATKTFKEYGVVTMSADWTKRNKVIGDYLKKFGRNSVPLYLLYHGESGEYTILPQILTNDIVIGTLKEKLKPKQKQTNKKK